MSLKTKCHCVLMFVSVLALFACQAVPKRTHIQPISKGEALALAVTLANGECLEKFSEAPFNISSYPIELKNKRWHWGRIDLAGINGYSAIVSFDVRGKDRRVEVFLSTDALTP